MSRAGTAAGSRAQSPLPRPAQPLTFWGRVGKFAPKVAASAGLIGAGVVADRIYNHGIVQSVKDLYQGTKHFLTGIGRGSKEVGTGFVNGYHAFKGAFKDTKPEDNSVKQQTTEEIHQGTSRQKNYDW